MLLPKEDQEARSLAKALNAMGYRFTHIANEIDIPWRSAIIARSKGKAMWVSKGFPDYMIISKSGSLVFIELKRQRRILKSGKLWASPSSIQPEQIERIETLSKIKNTYATICYWYKDALAFLQSIDKNYL